MDDRITIEEEFENACFNILATCERNPCGVLESISNNSGVYECPKCGMTWEI